jgi:hypothetical protein
MVDEVFRSEFDTHCDEIVHKLTQPTEGIILARNARLRNNPGAIRDLGKGGEGGTWGRHVASIPMINYDRAIRDGYDLNNLDSEIAGKEMHRFLQSPMGKACLVQGKN